MTPGQEALYLVAIAVNPVLMIVLGYMLKRCIERLETTIKQIIETQSACQISLPKVYRTIAAAEADSTRQWEKLDNHGERIKRLETLREAEAR